MVADRHTRDDLPVCPYCNRPPDVGFWYEANTWVVGCPSGWDHTPDDNNCIHPIFGQCDTEQAAADHWKQHIGFALAAIAVNKEFQTWLAQNKDDIKTI